MILYYTEMILDNFQAESCQIYVIRHKIFCSWLLNLTSAFVMEKCQLWTNFVIKVHFSPISSRFVWFSLTPVHVLMDFFL